jgi:hypothetical protein
MIAGAAVECQKATLATGSAPARSGDPSARMTDLRKIICRTFIASGKRNIPQQSRLATAGLKAASGQQRRFGLV